MTKPRIFLGSSGKQAKLLQAITGEIWVETADRATGYFTTRSDSDAGLNARTAGIYLRADPSDLQVLDGGSEEERSQLISQRLQEWKLAANVF